VRELNLSEKLQLLRKKNRLSQEELADKLGISRQAISKWESGLSMPDLNKLVILSELYNVTIDSLVKESDEYDNLQSSLIKDNNESVEKNKNTQIIINLNGKHVDYEYKSKRSLFGVPIVHINLGKGFKKAKGIIAVGNISYGIISVGLLSFGIFGIGLLSISLLSFAVISIGLLLAVGAISIGIISIGAIAIGVFSCGALAIGKYAVGAAAVASDIAIGDYARANIAIGNKVYGLKSLPLEANIEEVGSVIKSEYPKIKDWIIKLLNYFSHSIIIK